MQLVHPFSQRKKTSKIAGGVKIGWKENMGWKNFQRGGVGNKGGYHNIGGARNTPPTMIHKELFWKKDALVVQEKSLKRLVKEFIFGKVAGQRPDA